MGHIEARGEGVWRLTVGGGWDPETKGYKRVRKTFRGTREQAERELARLSRSTFRGTVGELLDDWLDHIKVGPATKADYTSIVENYLRPRFGKLPLDQLRARDLDRFYDSLTVGPARVRRIHTVIRGALKQGVKWEWVATNVALHASPPPVPKGKVRRPPPGASTTLLEVAEEHDPPMVPYLVLIAATGARRAEVCALRWEDFEPGELTIARAMVGKLVRPTKTDRIRTIAITEGTEEVLRRHKLRRQEECLTWGMQLPEFVFTNLPSESPWHPSTTGKRFARLRDLAGLPAFGLHWFRHDMASVLFAAGVDPITVAHRGGWANPNVPLRIYGHLQPAKDREAAEILTVTPPR